MKKQPAAKPFAKKSLGQNFLIDQNYVGKIISAVHPQPNETIMEIGPGRGALTKYLLESGANILAIELDPDLIPILRKEFRDYQNFQLIEEDALNVDFNQIPNSKSEIRKKLVANLPYYISTAILQRLIEQREQFSELTLMLQREVVDRITAKPGNKERGFLTVLVEAFCEPEKLFDVPPTAFRPAPKVWSSVVRLRVKENSEIENVNSFKELISKGFAQKRKTILNNLKLLFPNAFEILQICQIEPIRRAETLSLEEWQKIHSHCK